MTENSQITQERSLVSDFTSTHLPVDSTETSPSADSAIDMSKIEAAPAPNDNSPLPTLLSTVALSERLEQLTTAVWETEQEHRLSESWMQRLHEDLDKFERNLDGEEEIDEESQVIHIGPAEEASATAEPAQEEQLRNVLIHLDSTISSMRLRLQEDRHLHQLSRTKLEAVAQRCLVQETQLRDLNEGMRDLRQENLALGDENDTLRRRIEELEAEVTRREVAVDAMTSAVAGLQGWIEDPRHNVDNTPSPGARRTPRRTVIRGRGRFRGKYYVDEVEGAGSRHNLDDGSDAKDLHDGVKAWLRGFKDVEEEARSIRSDRTKTLKEVVEDITETDEDWGAFEVAS